MANFSLNSLSYLDHNTNNDINWDLLNPFISMNNQSLVQNSMIDYHSLMSDHQLLTHQSSLLQDKLSGMNTQLEAADPPTISELVDPVLSYGSRNLEHSGGATITKNKRKAEEFAESTSLNSSSPLSSDGNTKKNNSGRGKRAKCNDKAGEKPNEVVHVRARRGQATDSHSIAERIRRGKINERLKCLQDIVPGCNKTMGMAVMLDEIINYVQSLQNQVEFLSMKLTAASQFHDFNADTDDILEKLQRTNGLNGNDAQNMESTIARKGYDQVVNFTQPTWPF